MAIPPRTAALFICDIQARFSNAIWQFSSVAATTNKMLKFAPLLELPVLTTEQKPESLGPTFPDLNLAALPASLNLGVHSKTRFSMVVPPVERILEQRPEIRHIILVGIESHICVLQTALDLRARDYTVHVLADGVSSCNQNEIPIALATMRQAGAIVTTSESVLFRLFGDAGRPDFKAFANAIKEETNTTKQTLQAML